jgi:SAM-dependent methyltransferase
MTPDEVAATYNAIAAHWDSADFNRDNGIAQHERALGFVAKAGSALDVGCGSSGRIVELLLVRKFSVEGLDISPEMLARARRRHPRVTFHLADICTFSLPQRYDFISAWDSIWHVPLAQQLDVLRKLLAGLSPGGVLLFTAGGTQGPEEVTNPCLGQPLYHASAGIPAILRTLDECGCACRHLEYDQHPEKHVTLIAQRL